MASTAPAPVVSAPAAKPVEAKSTSSLPPPPLPKASEKTTTTVAAKPTVAAPAAAAVAAVKPVVTAATTTVAAVKPAVTPPVAKPEAKPAAKPLVATPPPAVAGFPTNAQLSQMGKGVFAWPVKGKILVPFGQLAPNVRNDGINIASSGGTDVVAAADGVVVYQGDQVRELGNTIYIKHPNGWYTGYSHLSAMKVTNNQKVTKGQVIGTVGQSGTIDQPQLHFEVRYTPSTDIARPIDPKLVLPSS
ncbi:lipoprotein nlpD [Asticcacaulis biprosthecium C19]|uniref:Lipoprotein nlpD n=1 Tax=Asticcacaulis biprosthecium C19 TaxID=715226 RepID=F4QQ31_9CAUL|nr:M23 family metallopeptidase [Asticcacaulis biprosthecium]EGF90318.1 lipoprotein nlpD [Asticcacaulis biprosthecium C19]